MSVSVLLDLPEERFKQVSQQGSYICASVSDISNMSPHFPHKRKHRKTSRVNQSKVWLQDYNHRLYSFNKSKLWNQIHFFDGTVEIKVIYDSIAGKLKTFPFIRFVMCEIFPSED